MAAAGEPDPVPLGHRFDVVWRGYNRRQVKEYLDMELRWLTADRDAAIGMVAKLAALLNDCRAELQHQRDLFDRQCRQPLSADALTDRMRRMMEIARAEASDIVSAARGRAEHIRVAAAEAALRQEAQAECRRQRIDEDFQIAMAERRAEALRNLHAYETARRAEADRVLRDARHRAAELLASAASQVETLRKMRNQLAHRLNLVRGLVLRTCSLLDPVDGDPVSAWVPSQERGRG